MPTRVTQQQSLWRRWTQESRLNQTGWICFRSESKKRDLNTTGASMQCHGIELTQANAASIWMLLEPQGRWLIEIGGKFANFEQRNSKKWQDTSPNCSQTMIDLNFLPSVHFLFLIPKSFVLVISVFFCGWITWRCSLGKLNGPSFSTPCHSKYRWERFHNGKPEIDAKTTKKQIHVLRHVALYQSEKEQHHSQRVSKLGLKILQLD